MNSARPTFYRTRQADGGARVFCAVLAYDEIFARTVSLTTRSKAIEIERLRGHRREKAGDTVAVEEPLELRVGAGPAGQRTEAVVSITMRTPGHDDELAAGFLFGEGLITGASQILKIWHRSPPAPDSELHNVLRVDLQHDVDFDLAGLERHFYATSSCGVCGKGSIEALAFTSRFADDTREQRFALKHDSLFGLPAALRAQQDVFEHTGGLHAAGLFNAAGEVTLIREDVGRHNALDKLVGRLLLDDRLPLHDHGIVVSGRSSFELVQKTLMTGCPMLAAIGAPSSLAVELAREHGLTLVGFLGENRGNIYTRGDRVIEGQEGQT